MSAFTPSTEQVAALTRAASRSSFAASLLRQHNAARRPLSAKQQHWFTKLADESLAAPAKAQEAATPPPADAINFSQIPVLMYRAKENLKYPKIHLTTEDNLHVQISIAGQRARYPLSINVTDGGRYPDNRYYGRIHPAGRYEPSRSVPASVTMAADHGHASGSCCFCNRELTHRHSLATGYGPVCAKNYGLPHGGSAAEEGGAA